MPQLTPVNKLVAQRCSCAQGTCLRQFQGQEKEIEKLRVDFQKSTESVKASLREPVHSLSFEGVGSG